MLYGTYRWEDKVKIVKLQTLRCEFDNLRMKDVESVEDFYNRIILLLNQLCLNGEITEDKSVVEKILSSLTSKFEYALVQKWSLVTVKKRYRIPTVTVFVDIKIVTYLKKVTKSH